MALKNTIFYSWQSDLPGKTNRGFIDACLKQVVKEMDQIGSFSIQMNVDRDTMGRSGTPSIVDSIFDKIDQAKLFVADISIINSGSDQRKTPNPNVLIELGYAARTLGWDKVICVYNLDYGSYDDLPFDLRQRRPLGYSLNGKAKTEVKDNIVKTITANIRQLHASGLLFDTISDYLKMRVDTEILTIVGYLKKIWFGYDIPNTLGGDAAFLNLSQEQLREKLENGKFLGFQVFKKFHEIEKKLTEITNHTLSSPHHGKDVSAILIDFISWVGRYDKFNSLRTKPDLFLKSAVEADDTFKVVSGLEINPHNQSLPDRYLLLQKMDQEHAQIKDFGDFVERPKIDGLLNYYSLNTVHVENYLALIRDFMDLTGRWLQMTNGEFIVDNVKMFELHAMV